MSDIHIQKIRQLDGSLLLIFQTLLRDRRTTAAAEQLGLSQPAISHALGRLRRLFDDPLFERRPHGLEPTPTAIELSPWIDAMLDAATAAFGAPAAFDPATASRSFRLSSSDYLAGLVAPGLLAAFRQEAPGCRFAIGLGLGDVALGQLRRSEIDLAIGRFAEGPGPFDFAPLFEDHYCLVLRRGHPEARDGIDRAAFERLDHVAVSVSGDFRTLTDRDFVSQGVRRKVVAAAPRFSIAFAMVATSDAACVAPRRFAQAQTGAFKLGLHDLPVALPPISVAAARRRVADPGLDWLIERLRLGLAVADR